MDRQAVNRALAKTIAFKQCGKDKEAAEWARVLVELLECTEILEGREVTEACEREWASEDGDGVHYCNRPAVDVVRINGYWVRTCGECGTELRRNPLA